MKRAERLYALVDVLRAARAPLSAARLAREFEVSTRTIERDVQSLQSAGVPIYADHGVTGGYSILREFSLPPLNLTVAESLAVLAGLGLLESSPYGAAARRARTKILAVIDEEHTESVRAALASMRVLDLSPIGGDDLPLDLLADAIAERRVVRIEYRAEDGAGSTTRAVEAMGLLRAGDSWRLVGFCRLRQGIRGFRIENITALQITDELSPERDAHLLDADLARWPTRRLGG